HSPALGHLVPARAAGDGGSLPREAPPRQVAPHWQLRRLGRGDDRVGRADSLGVTMARSRSIEPLLWTLFSAGGVAAALAMPILLLMFGIILPLAADSGPSYSHLHGLLRAWPMRLALFVLCALSLWHAAHRFRFTLYDGLQIKHLNELIAALCYGGAAVGS